MDEIEARVWSCTCGEVWIGGFGRHTPEIERDIDRFWRDLHDGDYCRPSQTKVGVRVPAEVHLRQVLECKV